MAEEARAATAMERKVARRISVWPTKRSGFNWDVNRGN